MASEAPPLFALGTTCGLLALPVSAYLDVTPRWLRWTLIGCAALMAVRYAAAAMVWTAGPESGWSLRQVSRAGLIGLTWPLAVAADQLVRHPAMTPTRLARWYAPFLAAGLMVLLLGRAELGSMRVSGGLLAGFAAVLSAVAGAVWQRLPAGAVKSPLALLIAASAACGVEGLAQAMQPMGRPWLWPEALVMLAVWNSFRTASRAPF